jgi:DNA-binding CsgD family transcriptional regulator
LAEADGSAVSHAFYGALMGFGATYLQTRVYSLPVGPLTPESHWRAGGVIARICNPEWPRTNGYQYICFERKPLVAPVRTGRPRWKFSDYAPHRDPDYADYWDVMGEADIGDALGVIVRGAGGRMANIHLGLGERDASPEAERALSFAALLLGERLLELDALAAPPTPQLTTRERDCLAYVAAGKTDWEISVILGRAEATVRFHIDNARRKLGAVNRAQAVAKLAIAGLL